MAAYQEAIRETSRPWAPWYAIPADRKKYMRVAVAEILEASFRGLPLEYPKLDAATRKELAAIREQLEAER